MFALSRREIVPEALTVRDFSSVGELEMIGISSDYRVKKDLDMRRIELAGW